MSRCWSLIPPVAVPVPPELSRGDQAFRKDLVGFSWSLTKLVDFSVWILPPFPLLDVFAGCVALFINCDWLTVPQVKELPALQKELIETKQALADATQDKEKLLQEIRKYNPLFELWEQQLSHLCQGERKEITSNSTTCDRRHRPVLNKSAKDTRGTGGECSSHSLWCSFY